MLPTKKTIRITDFNKMNTLIYGPPKVGKSSFCANIPNALFLTTEEGFNHLEIFNYPIKKWEDVYTLGQELIKEKNDFKCLVIDVADWFFKHCENYVMQKNAVSHPSDLPFGKGYSLIKDEFIRVVNKLNQLGYGLVFVSHAKEKELSTKTQKWTYMDSSMNNSASSVICGLVDFIFYFYIDADGKRLIRTKPTKHINAGDRSGALPELILLDYKNFALEFTKAMNKGETKNG